MKIKLSEIKYCVASKMIHVGDNSWNLRVLITDLQVEKTLRVKGDLHIGGVMLKLSKTEGRFKKKHQRFFLNHKK